MTVPDFAVCFLAHIESLEPQHFPPSGKRRQVRAIPLVVHVVVQEMLEATKCPDRAVLAGAEGTETVSQQIASASADSRIQQTENWAK